VIDAHFHIWQLARGDYGWLTPALRPIYRDVRVEDWRAVAAPCGVSRGILVQAAPTEAETAFLLDQASRHRDIAGVVGWVDMEAANAAVRIEALASDALLLGLRPMLHDIPDPAWILERHLSAALAAIAQAGLTFDALVRPVHLPHILELARRYPALRIVIDHGAKPDIAKDAFDHWARDMARLARETKAFCKISGLLTEAGSRAEIGSIRRYVDHLLVCFGPKRLLWGSDWPVLELAANYRQWHDMARAIVPQAFHLDVFEHTALAAYDMRDGSPGRHS
jgi:L-fucono-1,5-lactonase